MVDTGLRRDLHWLAVRLFQDLGSAEVPIVQKNGLSLWGYEVLRAVRDEPAASQLTLARALGVDKNRMVVIVDDLQDAGFVERIADPADRRNRRIEITAAGRRICDTTTGELDRLEAVALAALPQSRRGQWITDLHRVIETVRRLAQEKPQ